jgi:hypothetical protein
MHAVPDRMHVDDEVAGEKDTMMMQPMMGVTRRRISGQMDTDSL